MAKQKKARSKKPPVKHQQNQNSFLKDQTSKLKQYMENKCIAWCIGTQMNLFNEDLEKIAIKKDMAVALNICRVPWNIYTIVMMRMKNGDYDYIIKQVQTNRDFLYEDIGIIASEAHSKQLKAANSLLVCGVGWVARIDGGELEGAVCAHIMTELGHKKYLAPWEKPKKESDIEEDISILLQMKEDASNPWHKNMP